MCCFLLWLSSPVSNFLFMLIELCFHPLGTQLSKCFSESVWVCVRARLFPSPFTESTSTCSFYALALVPPQPCKWCPLPSYPASLSLWRYPLLGFCRFQLLPSFWGVEDSWSWDGWVSKAPFLLSRAGSQANCEFCLYDLSSFPSSFWIFSSEVFFSA